MHSGRALGERPLPGEPYPPPTLPAEAEGTWGWAVAIGERPRCTKGASHLLTREHSGTVRGMLTCWHTSTLTHTHIHTPINISLQPQPHTQECTHAQVCAHRSTHTQPALTAPITHHQSWPPAHILPPALALQKGAKASFSSNTLIHPSPVL